MDEIFSSTNPEEGISGAYAIANKLASNKNSISLITTHFSYLTNLEKTDKFKNYNIPIERDNNSNIKYTYKLQEGSSSQYIALELLRNKGFDNDIVESAQDICKKIIEENTNKSEHTNIVSNGLEHDETEKKESEAANTSAEPEKKESEAANTSAETEKKETVAENTSAEPEKKETVAENTSAETEKKESEAENTSAETEKKESEAEKKETKS